LDVQLKARGAFLAGYEYEDALSYFIARAWELQGEYDPLRGWSFSKLLRQRSYYWLTDFYRQWRGDSRYGQDITPEPLRDEDRPFLHIEWPEVLATINTALLSPLANRTLATIAYPHFVEQRPLNEIADEQGRERREVVRLLKQMASEIEDKCLKEAA
jgi:hypothetical protein